MEERPTGNTSGDTEKQPEIVLTPPSAEKNAEVPKEKVCPRCNSVNTPQSLFCLNCGSKLPDTAILDKKICTGCHTSNSPTSQYCYKCGLKLLDRLGADYELAGKYAGFWIRLLAFIIDGILIYIVTTIVAAFVYNGIYGLSSYTKLLATIESGTVDSSVWSFIGITVLTWCIVAIVYLTISIGKWGRTLGKKALGLKVFKSDGSHVSYWRAFGRYWAYMLCSFTLGIGFLVIAFTGKKQGIHDFICDTIVIKTN
jgi:uncharacterized RDD family membrane protein YckC/ribosomal protein L40E